MQEAGRRRGRSFHWRRWVEIAMRLEGGEVLQDERDV
jgi:hypothetical protein